MFETNVTIPEHVLEEVAFDAKATKTAKFKGMKFQVKKYLSVDEAIYFATEVIDGSFIDGEYNPLLKEISIRLAIVGYYTNIQLPESDYYDILYADGFMDAICKHIDDEQFYELIFSIDDKIEYMVQTEIGALERKLKPISDMLNDLSKMTETLSPEDIEAFAAAVSSGDFSEGAIVREMLNHMGAGSAEEPEAADEAEAE